MADRHIIVGIGELLVHDAPAGERVGGLAAEVAMHAARLGHHGVAVSRVGQDAAGADLINRLREAGVDVDHIQTDPDLATGRLTVRSIGGQTSRLLDPRAAFDNLQWDFDLEDIGQQAEAVVLGSLARRNTQTRTTIDRFLNECRRALRVFDLLGEDEASFDRTMVLRTLETCEGLVLDRRRLHLLNPGAAAEPDDVLASSLARRYQLTFVLMFTDDRRVRSFAGGETATTEGAAPEELHQAAIVGTLHGLLSGWDWPKSLAAGIRCAQFIEAHPDEDIPANLFDAT